MSERSNTLLLFDIKESADNIISFTKNFSFEMYCELGLHIAELLPK